MTKEQEEAEKELYKLVETVIERTRMKREWLNEAQEAMDFIVSEGYGEKCRYFDRDDVIHLLINYRIELIQAIRKDISIIYDDNGE